MKKIGKVLFISAMLISVIGPTGAVGAQGVVSGNSLQTKITFEEGVQSNEVSKQKLVAFERNAITAIQEESNKQQKSAATVPQEKTDENKIFNYTTADEDYTYFYESYTDGRESVIVVSENESEETSESVGSPTSQLIPQSATVTPLVEVNFPDGYGGRQKITSSGNVLTTSIVLPSTVTIAGNGVPYIYVGFSGSRESDMGLQYARNRGPSGTEGAFVPILRLSGPDVYGSHIAPNNQVSNRNGFHKGATVGLQAYKNYNSTGKVRLVTFGYAICSDSICSSTGNYYLTSIVEYTSTITSVTSWKVLATVAVLSGQSEGTATFTTTFNNIVIDFVAVPNSSFKTPETDYATISRSTNNVTININKTS